MRGLFLVRFSFLFFFSFLFSLPADFQQVYGTRLSLASARAGCPPSFTCARRTLLPLTNARHTPVRFFFTFPSHSLTASPSCSPLRRVTSVASPFVTRRPVASRLRHTSRVATVASRRAAASPSPGRVAFALRASPSPRHVTRPRRVASACQLVAPPFARRSVRTWVEMEGIG